MSRVKKTIGLDKIGIESLPVPEAVKQYLRVMVGKLEQMHTDLRETAESFGEGTTDVRITTNWRFKEVGNNLEFQKNDVKKAAVTG